MPAIQSFIKQTLTGCFSLLCALLFVGCGTHTRVANTTVEKHFKSKAFENQMSGLVVYDIENKKTLININGAQYFIPASNTKIFTLYTALAVLPEKMPLVQYQEITTDSILIGGMGDPTPFHPYFKDSTLLNIIKPYKNIGVISDNLIDHPYGPGWAWEDYDSYYAPERSSLPLFGNVFTAIKNDSVEEYAPLLFKSKVVATPDRETFYRNFFKNIFYIKTKPKTPEAVKGDSIFKDSFTYEIPFITSDSLTAKLLAHLSKKNIYLTKSFKNTETKIAYSISRDTVLKRMMEVSDNFLAEQLLLNAAAYKTDSLSIGPIKNYILNNNLKDLHQKPRWVDGSGLSRYNLFTPMSFVSVLNKLYESTPFKTLKTFFPIGGETGTLSNVFKGNPNPYIFAKSGSLGNTYCLSGFLKTKKGKLLIFSYMNNHFRKPTAQVKAQMEQVLKAIRDQN